MLFYSNTNTARQCAQQYCQLMVCREGKKLTTEIVVLPGCKAASTAYYLRTFRHNLLVQSPPPKKCQDPTFIIPRAFKSLKCTQNREVKRQRLTMSYFVPSHVTSCYMFRLITHSHHQAVRNVTTQVTQPSTLARTATASFMTETYSPFSAT